MQFRIRKEKIVINYCLAASANFEQLQNQQLAITPPLSFLILQCKPSSSKVKASIFAGVSLDTGVKAKQKKINGRIKNFKNRFFIIKIFKKILLPCSRLELVPFWFPFDFHILFTFLGLISLSE